MKATQLDSILRDYEHTEEQEAIMRDTITKKKDVCVVLCIYALKFVNVDSWKWGHLIIDTLS